MQAMVGEALSILGSTTAPLEDIGKLMHESWTFKRSLAEGVSNPVIDGIYDAAIAAGASGGKILGAGGGGFILFFAKPELQDAIREKLNRLIHVAFRFETGGSKILHY